MLEIFSVKFNNKYILFVLFLFFLCLCYCIIPYKIILSPELSQLVFVYDSEDSIDIQQQVSYTLGKAVSNTVELEKDSGNTILSVNKFILFKWLKDCEKHLIYIDSKEIEAKDNEIIVKCSKEDVPRKMIDADEYVRYFVVKQLLSGVTVEKINVKVTFIEEFSDNILISADWPIEEYNVDRNQFFDETETN